MLVVIAGLPGTGKTTLSRRLAAEMSAAVVRLDAVEAAIVRSGELKPPLGPVGYLIAQAVVTGCLAVGTPVVVDAVSPGAEARAGWRTAAAAAGAPVHVFEVVLDDLGEHQRRVEQRRSDLEGLVVPTWDSHTGSAPGVGPGLTRRGIGFVPCPGFVGLVPAPGAHHPVGRA